MTPQKKRDIVQLAETVRESLELEVPIDVDEAVKRLGGQVTYVDSLQEGMEAMVKRTGERFEIVLDKNKPKLRQRFSIAHELGHLFLHMGYLVDSDRWQKSDDYKDAVFFRFGYSEEEEEAHEFAAAFLMPEEPFREISELNSEGGKCQIKQVAGHFKTSHEAAFRRGKSLGLFSVTV